MHFEIFYGDKNELFKLAREIRLKVFVEEEGIDINLEIDGKDSDCYQIVFFCENKAAGTARFSINENNQLKIQRVAVLKDFRGQGVGQKMMEAIEKWGQENNFKEAALSAQKHALGFYEKLGYQKHGGEYLEAGIPHYDMTKKL